MKTVCNRNLINNYPFWDTITIMTILNMLYNNGNCNVILTGCELTMTWFCITIQFIIEWVMIHQSIPALYNSYYTISNNMCCSSSQIKRNCLLVCYYASHIHKHECKIDNILDAFAVYSVAVSCYMLVTRLFVTSENISFARYTDDSSIYASACARFGMQKLAIVAIISWKVANMTALFYILKYFDTIRAQNDVFLVFYFKQNAQQKLVYAKNLALHEAEQQIAFKTTIMVIVKVKDNDNNVDLLFAEVRIPGLKKNKNEDIKIIEEDENNVNGVDDEGNSAVRIPSIQKCSRKLEKSIETRVVAVSKQPNTFQKKTSGREPMCFCLFVFRVCLSYC